MNDMRKLIKIIENIENEREEGSTDIQYPNYEDHEKEMLHRLNWLQARMEEQLDWIRQVKVNKRQRNPEPEEIAQTAIGLIKFLKKNSPD